MTQGDSYAIPHPSQSILDQRGARGTPEYRNTALKNRKYRNTVSKNRKYRNTVSKIVNTALQFTKRDCNLLFILLHIYTELPSSKLFFPRNTVCLNAKSRIPSGLRIP